MLANCFGGQPVEPPSLNIARKLIVPLFSVEGEEPCAEL